MTTRLDDLIHNEQMVSVHQSVALEDCYPKRPGLERAEAKTVNALKLFGQSPTIKTFLVNDFFKRAKETL